MYLQAAAQAAQAVVPQQLLQLPILSPRVQQFGDIPQVNTTVETSSTHGGHITTTPRPLNLFLQQQNIMKRILLAVSMVALSKCAKLRGIISEPIALTSQVPTTITTTNPTVITSAPTLQVPSLASYQIPITTTPQLINPYAQLGNVYSSMLPTIQTIPSIDYLRTISASNGSYRDDGIFFISANCTPANAEKLGLTKEQKEKAEVLRKEGREKMEPLMKQKKELHEKMEKLRKENMEEFEKILTDEQKEKLEEIKKERKGKFGDKHPFYHRKGKKDKHIK